MSLKSRKTRPYLLAGSLAFAACIWPTLYSPLGVDRSGNPMRENRITGVEEVKPAGYKEWIDAAQYLKLMNAGRANGPVVVQR
jgi:hypothetical protein